jgi:hypothetical protein
LIAGRQAFGAHRGVSGDDQSSGPPRSGKDRKNRYDEVVIKIIGELEVGRVPWVQPLRTVVAKAPLAMPTNAATGRGYSGINVLILWVTVVEHGVSAQKLARLLPNTLARLQCPQRRMRHQARLCRSLHSR